MKIKSLIVLITCVFSFVSLFIPGISMAKGNFENVTLNSGDEKVEIIVDESTDKKTKFKVKGNNWEDVVEVEFDTGNFKVTKKNGNVQQYNVKDFIVDEKTSTGKKYSKEEIKSILKKSGKNIEKIRPLKKNEVIPFDELEISNSFESEISLMSTAPRYYITDLNTKLGVSGTIDWEHIATYKSNPLDVYAYQAYHDEYRTTAKKLSFDSWTALSVVLGAIVAVVGAGFGMTALVASLQGLGVAYTTEAIKYAWEPTIQVKRFSNLRSFYVQNNGFTTVTKTYADFVEFVDRGQIHLEHYDDGKYYTWYNDLATWKVSDVAYQMYRYIEGYRDNTPQATEFYWY